MNTIKYYKENYKKIFRNIKNSQWRVFKIIDEDNYCIQNDRPITNAEELLKFIKAAKNPKALYMSVSQFQNPHLTHGAFYNQRDDYEDKYIYPRKGYIIADNILIDTELFIDLDSEKDLNIAQEDGRKIITHLEKRKDYKLRYVGYSGKKGIHILYKMKKPQIRNPNLRIEYYKQEKEKIINELLTLNLETINKAHIEIIKNNFCVYAVPYSIKDNGRVVTPIKKQDFMNKSIYTILSIRKKDAEASEAAKPMTKKVALSLKGNLQQPKNIGGGRRASLSSCPQLYYLIPNFVPGMKDHYVPFIKIHKRRWHKIDLKDLVNKISHFIVFEETNYYWIVGLKVFQKITLLRLMRKLKASNYSEFSRRYAKFRYTNILDTNDKEIEQPPMIVCKRKSEKEYTYSRAHYNFFREFNIKSSLLRGSEDLKTYLGKVI